MSSPKKERIIVNLTNCKYPVVRDCVRRRGWKILIEDGGEERDGEGKRGEDPSSPLRTKSTADWDLYWQDAGNVCDKLAGMRPWQRINHWPGNVALCRKDGLARSMKRMARVFPHDFDFVPRTWTLPDDWADFQAQFPAAASALSGGPRFSKVTFIVKPAASSQGRGIYLTRKLEDVDPRTPSIAQRYISKPFLIDGLKFDMRIYVLVTSMDPLRVWLYDEGLCRFATSSYTPPTAKNFANVKMHLTNYAINKDSPNFVFNKGGVESGSTGSKRTLTWFKQWLDANGFSANQVFGRIAHMINKAIIAARPHIMKTFKASANTEAGGMQAFELFGLDVLLDNHLRPWLLESNMSPSLTCDTKLDYQIKAGVVGETMDLLRLRVTSRRKGKAKQLAAARQRLYGTMSGPPASPLRVSKLSRDASKSEFGPDPGKSMHDGVMKYFRRVPLDHPIPPLHQRHEVNTIKGFRLIYPPPDVAEIDPGVWGQNADEAALMKATMVAKGLSSPKKAADVYAPAGGEDDDTFAIDSKADDGAPADTIASSVGDEPVEIATPSANLAAGGMYDSKIDEDNLAAAEEEEGKCEDADDDIADNAFAASAPDTPVESAGDGKLPSNIVPSPIIDGVPLPYHRPWDTSTDAFVQRVRSYALYCAVGDELYSAEERVMLTAGRRAAESLSISSASLITAAVRAAVINDTEKSRHATIYQSTPGSGSRRPASARSRSRGATASTTPTSNEALELMSITRMLQTFVTTSPGAKSVRSPVSPICRSRSPVKLPGEKVVVVLSGIRADGSQPIECKPVPPISASPMGMRTAAAMYSTPRRDRSLSRRDRGVPRPASAKPTSRGGDPISQSRVTLPMNAVVTTLAEGIVPHTSLRVNAVQHAVGQSLSWQPFPVVDRLTETARRATSMRGTSPAVKPMTPARSNPPSRPTSAVQRTMEGAVLWRPPTASSVSRPSTGRPPSASALLLPGADRLPSVSDMKSVFSAEKSYEAAMRAYSAVSRAGSRRPSSASIGSDSTAAFSRPQSATPLASSSSVASIAFMLNH